MNTVSISALFIFRNRVGKMSLFDWLSEHLTCECGPLRGPTKLRRLAYVVDLSAVDQSLRFDLTQDVIIDFSQFAKET